MNIKSTINRSIISIFVMFNICSCQTRTDNTNDTIQTKVKEIITAFNNRNISVISKNINKDFGIIILHKIGLYTEVDRRSISEISEIIPRFWKSIKFDTMQKINYAHLPHFKCENERWSKTGLFCNLKGTDRTLSNAALALIKYREDPIDQQTINEYKNIEKKSRRIILSDSNGNDLIFHLSLIDGKWYLTLLDFDSSDCSA